MGGVRRKLVSKSDGSSAGSGVGLGLAVARGLSEAVGASIEVEDTPGGGLTMVLSIPLASHGDGERR